MYISRPNCVIITEDKKNATFISRLLDEKDAAINSRLNYEKHNVCPECHFVLPTSGVCDCGYVKQKINYIR